MDNELIVAGMNTALDILIDVFLGGTSDKLKLLKSILMSEGRISDILLYNNFCLFLKHGRFRQEDLRKLSAKLEEQGNKKSHALMIIKTIDDIESEEKARCLANLTQSVINGDIIVSSYLRLIHTCKLLIAEDFNYISDNISGETLLDDEHLDDFITAGITRAVDGGYVYTERAHDLMEFGIARGHDYKRPQQIKKRTVFGIGISDYGQID